ncbi:stage V sporulation protein R [Salsuginibacillus halophilus]|uniref:Stage V sporulation protein R n=1 Tax=Salsuginibacillus halophilus TaxID=517424 RepID=A0A2P8HG43_9BACI|nr:SpoVR family protein [Salsuginibacillus halophilus]PSL45191.1 stage V sporulation protein R [Salsuginibacillus halophilus]
MIDRELERSIVEITEVAESFGLDFYPMRYEQCPADIIYTFGAYGMPTRYSHWSFGKQYHKMKLHYDLGLSKIYELVINSNPCYAFLLDSNTLIQNKLIVAHVLAHSDFFKNNSYFQRTRQDMVESMSAASERIAAYEHQYGKREVETFLDAVLAIQEHVDPSLWRNSESEESAPPTPPKAQPYEDLLKLGDPKQDEAAQNSTKKFPPEPEKDLLYFIEENSRELEDWQRDVITLMREEMLYFWPQLETKIMNEGWASYWHIRILRELDLTEGEAVEFAKLNASVVQPGRQQLNPYYLGLKMFEDIERRFNDPDEHLQELGVVPNSGRKQIFDVREMDHDVSFVRNYLTDDLIRQEDLFMYEKQGRDYRITSKDAEDVRQSIIRSRTNGGFPYLVVTDGDYMKAGELYIRHEYEGVELDVKELEKTLPYLFQLWGRAVHIETFINDKPTLFQYDGRRLHRKYI